jgi:hypothetical protein
MEEALTGLVDARLLDRRELRRLADKIASAQSKDSPKRGKK